MGPGPLRTGRAEGCRGQPEPRGRGGLGGRGEEEVLILILRHIEILLPQGESLRVVSRK